MTASDPAMNRTRRNPSHGSDSARLHRPLFRWMPIVAVAMGVAGFAQVMLSPSHTSLGFVIMTVSGACSVWLPAAGPLRTGIDGAIADEFDRALRARAYLAAFASIAFTAQIGIMLVAALALLYHWPRELLITALIGLAMLLPLLWLAMPTLHAAWSAAPLDDE